jgi:hypothetical protein
LEWVVIELKIAGTLGLKDDSDDCLFMPCFFKCLYNIVKGLAYFLNKNMKRRQPF